MATARPSEMALAIAKALYPYGLPNTSYCWGDDEERNERAMQADRNIKAEIIDSVLRPEFDALVAVEEAAEKYHKERIGYSELRDALVRYSTLRNQSKEQTLL